MHFYISINKFTITSCLGENKPAMKLYLLNSILFYWNIKIIIYKQTNFTIKYTLEYSKWEKENLKLWPQGTN